MIVAAHRFIVIIGAIGVAVSLLLLLLGEDLKLRGLIMT
jgi:hypothetical protein